MALPMPTWPLIFYTAWVAPGEGKHRRAEPRVRAKRKAQHRARRFFRYDHLPPHLQAVSKPFGDLADNPQRVMTLTKLLESKDAAVRALLFKPAPE